MYLCVSSFVPDLDLVTQRKMYLKYAAPVRQFSYFAGTILPGFLWKLRPTIHHQIMGIWILIEMMVER